MPPATTKKKAEEAVPELTDALEEKAINIAEAIRAGTPASEKQQRALADAFLGALNELTEASADSSKYLVLDELAEKDQTLRNYLDHAEKVAAGEAE
ncbi:MAG TPA: hypothetical protein PK788_09180 [Gemmatimonadaceae bacterium]|nr:hypothetical protein [Gemmatimonadaceae bacterium]